MNNKFRRTLMAAAMTLALVAPGSQVVADTAAQNITEARQETQIWTTYALSRNLRASDLRVSVHRGKATLTGNVEDGISKELAREVALGVAGITEVDNKIVVQPDYVQPEKPASRSYGEIIDDATITSMIKSKLLWSKYTDGLATDVDTNRGNVTLTGTADTAAAKALAGRLATNTQHVLSVDNQLVVTAAKPTVGAKVSASARGAKQSMSDTWITAKVKSTFMYSSNVQGSDISVHTEAGIVTLTGTVDNKAERKLAVELANNVRGVKRVRARGLKS